jgi:hypothetical protein
LHVEILTQVGILRAGRPHHNGEGHP